MKLSDYCDVTRNIRHPRAIKVHCKVAVCVSLATSRYLSVASFTVHQGYNSHEHTTFHEIARGFLCVLLRLIAAIYIDEYVYAAASA